MRSPSSRGRGLKWQQSLKLVQRSQVALFTRAWIEIKLNDTYTLNVSVALFTRAWIEIEIDYLHLRNLYCRPLHEGVD